MSEVSKTQIDRLGDRLKKSNFGEADLRLLDEYRLSFTDSYEVVVGRIRKELELEPTGRPAKSTSSISEKLRRESIRLTQIQDIAGCRLVVADISSQERVITALQNLFDNTTAVDRRKEPSHGYRAFHLIVKHADKLVEIQIRTSLQQLWAELSEKLSDTIDPALKYGGGDLSFLELLGKASEVVAGQESNDLELVELKVLLSLRLKQDRLSEETQKLLARVNHDQKKNESTRLQVFEALREAINVLPRPRKQ